MINLPPNETREPDFASRHPMLAHMAAHPDVQRGFWGNMLARMAGLAMQQHGTPVQPPPATPAVPQAPAPAAPATPAKPMGASLGQLFSGYGY